MKGIFMEKGFRDALVQYLTISWKGKTILNVEISFCMNSQVSKHTWSKNNSVKRTSTANKRVMPYSCTLHWQYLAPTQWALPDIHHVSFLVVEDGTDLMHWMRNYLFSHMPVLVIGFSGSCQILPFANKGHMFPQRKIWQMVHWWLCDLS